MTDVSTPLTPFEGQGVWLNDKKEGWVAAVVTEIAGLEIKLKLYSGEEVYVPSHAYESLGADEDGLGLAPASDRRRLTTGKRRNSVASTKQGKRVLPRETGHYGRDGYDDMDNMPYLHEASVLNNLKHRFQMNQIYTCTGPILIAMNPFKWLDIYDTPFVEKYHHAVALGDLPSHCYQMAERVFRSVFADSRDKAIVVCGESGAGKTETTKLMLHYFSLVAGGDAFDHSIERRIMDSNPLLEAFGNAKTVRNNNSSRFGKYVQIFFDGGTQQLHSGAIRSFLLEKSRAVFQPDLERNFHIFYQLCEGADDDLRSTLKLGPATDYYYLNQTGCIEVDTVADEDDFAVTRQAMATLGLTLSQQFGVLKVVAGHLHLGNVEFEDDESGVAVLAEDAPLMDACEMLGVDPHGLLRALTTRTFFPPDGTPVTKSFSRDQAENARDAFAKMVYSALFDWLIERVNTSLMAENGKLGAPPVAIGILDIYGFESLLENGFEQLFINYANEKLQFLFNKIIFDGESKMYSAEGIRWDPNDFPSNAPCLQLIEGAQTGVLSLLEEECLLGHGTDLTFCRKISTLFGKKDDPHPHFSACGPGTAWKDPSTSRPTTEDQFVIRHFAGNILYTTKGFLEKNRDTVASEFNGVVLESESSVVQGMFKGLETRAALQSAGKGNSLHSTVGKKFKGQLKSMVDTIQASNPVFLRCIKSNNFLREKVCDSTSVLRQLKSNGVLPALEMRRAGYPSRMPYETFCKEYLCLGNLRPQGARTKTGEWKLVAKSIMGHRMVVENNLLASTEFGSSRIFFRNGVVAVLNGIKESVIQKEVVRVQSFVRGACQRKHYLFVLTKTIVVQKSLRGYFVRKNLKLKLVDMRRRAAYAVVLQKLEAVGADMDAAILVAKDAVVDTRPDVDAASSDALVNIKRARYVLSKGINSTGDAALDDIAIAKDSVGKFVAAVHKAIEIKSRVNLAREGGMVQLQKTKTSYNDLLAMRDALFATASNNQRLGDKSGEITEASTDAGKMIKAAEEMLASDNSLLFGSSVAAAGKAVEHAAKLVIEEREWFTNLKEAKAGALSALSDTVDMFSATITQADEEELWGSALVQAAMDEAQNAIDNAEIAIESSESAGIFAELNKSVSDKTKHALAVVEQESRRRSEEQAEVSRAKELLQACTQKIAEIHQTVNAAGISDIYVVKSSKEVAEDAIATARRCSISTSLKSFVAAVDLANTEILKAETVCLREKEKKVKLDADRRHGENSLEPALSKFASLCAVVKVSELEKIPEVEECIENSRKAINSAVVAIDVGNVSNIHTTVADAIRRVNIAGEEVTRIKEVLGQVQNQRRAAVSSLEPFQRELQAAVATIDAAGMDRIPHIDNAVMLAQKSLEEANAVLAKKEVSLTDRFNTTVSIAIERVQEAVAAVTEEKNKRDGWTRQKRRLWNQLEPKIEEYASLKQMALFGNVQDVPLVKEPLDNIARSIEYARTLLKGNNTDNGVVAVATLDDVAEKLVVARTSIDREQKRKATAEREQEEARQKLKPVSSMLATLQATIDTYELDAVDTVVEAFDIAKRAVNGANRSMKTQSATSVSAAIGIAAQKTSEVKDLVAQELNRIERLKREQKHANDVFTKMSNAFAAAAVRSEIEKVDGVEEVEHNHRTAAELLDNAAPLFGSGRERLDHDEKQFPLEMYANIVKDITGAVSLYESCVAQEIANKKESERLRLVRLEEERKREAKRARELKMVEEEAARVRTKAQNMVDPAMKKLAALKATIELQGLGSVAFIGTRLNDATDAVNSSTAQILSGDSTVAMTAVYGAVQMVDHLEEAVAIVKKKKAEYTLNEQKKATHHVQLLGALRTFEEYEDMLDHAVFNDRDAVLRAMNAGSNALHDAQQVCQPSRFDYIVDSPGDTTGFAPYTPVEKVDASVRAATSLVDLAVKTAEREKQIAEEKEELRHKLDHDKKLIQEAHEKYAFVLQKLGALRARFLVKSAQEHFADKNAVDDALQAAEAAAQSARTRLNSHDDDPAGISASVKLALQRVTDASKTIEREETRLVISQRRVREDAMKRKQHRTANRGKILDYIKKSKSTKDLFGTERGSDEGRRDGHSGEKAGVGYFTRRRKLLEESTNTNAKARRGAGDRGNRPKRAYKLRLTPAMLSLLPKHAARRLLKANESESEGEGEEERKEAPKSPVPEPTPVKGDSISSASMGEIEAGIKERLAKLSLRNKQVSVPSRVEPATPSAPASTRAPLQSPVSSETPEFIPPQEPPVTVKTTDIRMEMGRSGAIEMKEELDNERDVYKGDEISDDNVDMTDEVSTGAAEVRVASPTLSGEARSVSPETLGEERAKERILSLLAGVIHRRKSLFGRTIESLRVAFRKYDRKGNGLVYVNQFQRVIGAFQTGLSSSQKTMLLKAMDDRSDGKILYEPLCRALQLKRSALLRGMTAEDRFRSIGRKKPKRVVVPSKSKSDRKDWEKKLRSSSVLYSRSKTTEGSYKTNAFLDMARKAKALSQKSSTGASISSSSYLSEDKGWRKY
jgi:hypothetical protein